MDLNVIRTRQYLREFDFKRLFIEELGWDQYATKLDVTIDGQDFILNAVAEKLEWWRFGVTLCPIIMFAGRLKDW